MQLCVNEPLAPLLCILLSSHVKQEASCMWREKNQEQQQVLVNLEL